MKIGRLNSFTNQGEVEMMTVIHKLHKKTDDVSKTIEDMSIHAYKYSHDIGDAGVALNGYIADGKLQVIQFGVQCVLDDDTGHLQQFDYIKSKLPRGKYADSSWEAMIILHRASLFFPTDLRWYIRACEASDSILLSCNSIIHDNIRSIIKFITAERARSMDKIHEIINCVLGNNLEAFMVLNECKDEWRRRTQLFSMVSDYYDVCRKTCQLFSDFVRLLKDVCDSWMSVKLEFEGIVVKIREDNYTCKEILHQFNGIEAATGVFSIMSALMVGYFIREGREDLEYVWLHLNRSFSLRDFLCMCDRLIYNKSWLIKDFSDIHARLRGLK
ncbi:uncharacterized protein [Rutidosis leptorrhynchoides]|uniref:uncharacterized protein isoform X2 n=1 Tax=Rutidosis leptorrhynchoides TaxID=125765 RepID=UPI003A992AA3